jgi:hypothetical protein
MPDWEKLVGSCPPEVAEVAERLRAIVKRVLPQASEGVYGGAKTVIALYSIGGSQNVICGIQPAAKHCLFYIHHVQQQDSAVLKLEGKGKTNRHVKVSDTAAIEESEVERLLGLAVERA